MATETVFTYGAPLLKFGTGAADEFGWDLLQDGVSRVLLVTDPVLARNGVAQRVIDGLLRYGIEVATYDQVHVEPTDLSLGHAVESARSAGRSTPSSRSAAARRSTPPRR